MRPTARSTTPCTATRRRATTTWCSGTSRSASSKKSGPNVRRVKPGDYVTATVRRPGGSIYDLIGTNDMTSEETYYERGINLRHGYLTEYFVDDEEYIVRVPQGLKHLHVLMEPMSCAAKAVHQAYRSPAADAGLAAAAGVCAGRRPDRPLSRRSSCGCAGSRSIRSPAASRARSTARSSRGWKRLRQHARKRRSKKLVKKVGKADLIIDATGSSHVAFDAMRGSGPQRRAGLDQHHRRQPAARSPLRQDQHRLGARQQAAARLASTPTASTSKWASATWPWAK